MIERPLSGDVMVFDLAAERDRTDDPSIVGRSGRNARTLLKDGPLRVTLVVIAPGGEIGEHTADGPVTVHPLAGRILLRTPNGEESLAPGQLLALAGGVPHSVASEEGGEFLLTVVQPEPRPD